MNHAKEIGNGILRWYLENKRDLPWRKTEDPYKIWVSEIMLQQTRVETVVDYYQRFMDRFPDIQVLAEAKEEEVLTAWKGLGYYSRARNLHKAAKVIIEKKGGTFPDTIGEVKVLPGIGSYTAGAIMSIAFNQPFPAVDGNVSRVVARIYSLKGDITQDKVKKDISDIVMHMIPEGQARDFSQALMELGAMVCMPQSFKCKECPAGAYCKAYLTGTQGEIPLKKKKNPPQEYEWWVAWIEDDGRVLMEHRTHETLLANLWGFPMVKREDGKSEEELFREKYELRLSKQGKLGTVGHVFTHQIWKMNIDLYVLEDGETVSNPLVWRYIHELEALAVPKVFQKVIKVNSGL